jgi:peptidoglycan/LPS O-acetylase OafA/YrhL
VWAAAFAAGLVLVVAAPVGSVLGRCGQSPPLRFFGRYSYAMYAFQLPLVYLLAPLATAPGLAQCWGSPVVGQVTYCALMCLATTLAAVVSWHGFEKHVLAWKPRFP